MSEIRIPHASPAPVEAITTYDDGRFVLSLGGDTARWWDAERGIEHSPTLPVTDMMGDVGAAVVTMPDGRRIAVARSGLRDLWRWDLSTGELLGPVFSMRLLWNVGPSGAPMAVIATDDSAVIVTSRIDGALLRHDLSTGRQTGLWPTPHGRIWALAPVTLPDGRRLVASGGTDATVRLWDPVTAEPWGEPIEGCGTPVRISPGVLPDGRVVVSIANAQGNVHTRDVLTGLAVGPRISTGWQPHGWVKVCRIEAAWLATPRGPVVATCIDAQVVHLWDPISGRPAGEPIDDPGRGITVLAGAGSHLWVGDGAGNLSRFDVDTGAQVGAIVRPHGNIAHQVHVAPVDDGRLLLTVMHRGQIRRFDARTGDAIGDPYRPQRGGAYAMVSEQLPDGRRLLVTADDNGIYRMDLGSGVAYPPTPEERPFSMWDVTIVRLPDGRSVIAAAGHNGLVYRWDAATGVPLGEPLQGHRISVKAITSVARKDAAMIVSGCEAGEIRRWNAETGVPIGEPLAGDIGMVCELATLTFADGRHVVVGVDFDGGLHQWDPWTGNVVRPQIEIPDRAHLVHAWVDRDETPRAVLYSEDDDTGEVSIHTWRLDDGTHVDGDIEAPLRNVYRDGDQTVTVTAHPDGSLVMRSVPESWQPPCAVRETIGR